MKKDEHNIDFNLFGDYELAGSYIAITSRCNLRCKHCYNESGELRKELDLQAFLNAYDGIPDTEECSISCGLIIKSVIPILVTRINGIMYF